MNRSDSLLDASIVELLSNEDQLPIEVSDCLRMGLVTARVQRVASTNMKTRGERMRLGAQVGAVANGALLDNATSGYIVVDPPSDPPAIIPNLRHILAILDEHVQPSLSVSLGNTPQGSWYIRVVSPRGAPLFAQRVDTDGYLKWRLPIWKANESRWEVLDATHEARSLFQEWALGFFSGTSSYSSIATALVRLAPQTNREFAAFLAGLLLDTASDTRARAVEAFSLVGGLAPEVRLLIANLLSATLDDEPEVAYQAIASLRSFGHLETLPPVVRTIERHTGESQVQAAAIRFIGEFGTVDYRDVLVELYPKLSLALQFTVDASLVQLYQRHGLSTYDPTIRSSFYDRCHLFQYSHALELLQRYGDKIVLPTTLRSFLGALTAFADRRKESDYKSARDILVELRATTRDDDTGLRELVDAKIESVKDWFGGNWDSPEEALTTLSDWEIAELFFKVDCAFILQDRGAMLDELYTFTELAAKHVAAKCGVHFTSDRTALEQEWLDARPEIKVALRRRQLKPISRAAVCIILALLDDGSRQAADIITRYENVLRLRNKKTHVAGTISETEFSDAYAGGIGTMLEDARALCALCTGKTLNENPFVNLNRDIRWVLKRADDTPVSAAFLKTPHGLEERQ